MRTPILRILALTVATIVLPTILPAQAKDETSTIKVEAAKTDTTKSEQFKPEQQASKGSVTVGGNVITTQP
jgi:hypothetical protein